VQQGFGGATDLTEVIMLECNLDTHTAHRIVGRAVRLALENEVPLSAALLDEAAQAIIERPLALSEETISDTLNPTAIVNSRTGVGGASPSSTQAMLATFRQTVAEGERWRQDWTNRLTAAEKALLAQVEALCQRT
jgi:argininosuccinate lyase